MSAKGNFPNHRRLLKKDYCGVEWASSHSESGTQSVVSSQSLSEWQSVSPCCGFCRCTLWLLQWVLLLPSSVVCALSSPPTGPLDACLQSKAPICCRLQLQPPSLCWVDVAMPSGLVSFADTHVTGGPKKRTGQAYDGNNRSISSQRKRVTNPECYTEQIPCE